MLPEKDPAHKFAIQPIEKRPLLKKSKTIELKGDSTPSLEITKLQSSVAQQQTMSPRPGSQRKKHDPQVQDNDSLDENAAKKQQKEDARSDGTTG